MIYFYVAQLALAAGAVWLVVGRVRVLLFEAPLDTNPFLRAVRAAVEDGDEPAALAMADAGRPAWVAEVAAAALRDEPVDEVVSDIRFGALEHLWALRVVGSAGTAMGFLGAVIEIIWLFEGDHGLAGLKAGLPEQMAIEGAALALAIGVAIAGFAFMSLAVLRRSARDLMRDVDRAVLELDKGLDPADNIEQPS